MPDSHLAAVTTPRLEATELEDLLTYLSQAHQVDLTGYKRASLMRRTVLRMQQVGAECYPDYLLHLQQHAHEVRSLLDTIFINFTYFFRDPFAWGYLADRALPSIVADKAPNESIRVWSAGCASGEETYSLAMLLIETLGIEQFQQRVQIYGTDIDLDALLQACEGHYPAYKIEALPVVLQRKYFERRNDDYRWRRNLYGSIYFYPHNLIQTSPLPEIDLLVCRNLLIYLTAETQLQVLTSLYSSLRENGFLLLGNAETLVTRPQRALFTPVHPQNRVRIFKKTLNTP